MNVENFNQRFEYGEPHMKKLSVVDVKDIVAVIEKIWMNSCSDFYDTIPYGESLKKAYDKREICIEYNAEFEIKKIKICWTNWDYVVIELTAYGLTATFKPEHKSPTNLLDITWVLLENYFKDCYQK